MLGIRRGIQIIASQLETATLRMSGDLPATISGSTLAHAESSMRRGPHSTSKTSATAAYPYADDAANPSGASPFGQTAPTGGLSTSNASFMTAEITAVNELGSEFPPLFEDPSYQQAIIAELLGESQVGTDDPFAFFSSEGWGDSAL